MRDISEERAERRQQDSPAGFQGRDYQKGDGPLMGIVISKSLESQGFPDGHKVLPDELKQNDAKSDRGPIKDEMPNVHR